MAGRQPHQTLCHSSTVEAIRRRRPAKAQSRHGERSESHVCGGHVNETRSGGTHRKRAEVASGRCIASKRTMARRGVLQLRKLQVHFCDFGGSSAGVREFLRDVLPRMTKDKPQAEIETVMRRGRHPFVTGEYVHGNERVVCLRNKRPEEVKETIDSLCNTYGRKVKKIKRRTLTSNPSIQGVWSVGGPTETSDAASV